jgi:hypothetical protein
MWNGVLAYFFFGFVRVLVLGFAEVLGTTFFAGALTGFIG